MFPYRKQYIFNNKSCKSWCLQWDYACVYNSQAIRNFCSKVGLTRQPSENIAPPCRVERQLRRKRMRSWFVCIEDDLFVLTERPNPL